MFILLFLVLGLGVSVLVTELSVGLKEVSHYLVAAAVFAGYCIALLVGSTSNVTKHPQLYAVILYWVIVGIGSLLNMLTE